MRRISLLLSAVIIFFACETQRSAKIVINYLYWGDIVELKMNEHWVSNFEKLNPDIKVNRIPVSGEGMLEKILTMTASGESADVFYIWPEAFQDMIQKNAIYPLSDLMKRDNVQPASWFEMLLKPYTYKNKIYGLPRSWHPYVIYYNKDLFDRQGVPYPTENWTWADLIKYGKMLVQDHDKDGINDTFAIAGLEENWQILIWSYGVDYLVNNNTKGNFSSSEVKKALNLLRDCIFRYNIAPSFTQLKQVQGGYQMFMTGRVAMFISGLWVVPEFRKASFKWDIVPFFKGKQNATKLVTAGWAMGNTSKNREASWKLIKYLSGEEAQMYQTMIGRDPSGLKNIFNKYLITDRALAPQNRDAIQKSIKFGQFDVQMPNRSEFMNKCIIENLELVFSDKNADVDKICREIDQKIAAFKH